ncbi:MAG: Fic family protein [Candidatus Marinimicrobia bacterium]|nr:Fic family protein [Candidatus Neomarinimicrobiota bacterium]
MRILKRKKGNRYYFYLQHSFREKGKVVTREKYIGAAIPKNIDQIKRDFKKEIQPDLYHRLESVKQNFQKDWGKLPASIKTKQKEELAITFTYNTNAIEGSTISEAEVRGIVLDKISPGKSLSDIKEAESHHAVFLDMLENGFPISNRLLLNWHKNIFGQTKPELAGKYRDYNVRVGSHIAPQHQKVKWLLNQLVRFIVENKKDINPVEMSAIAHYRFEKIHPFGDGNGRVGRLLMNHILWFSGYPILIIEYKNRNAYYRGLEKNEDGFTGYFFRRYLTVDGKVN